jgi:hypothetical protein
LLSLDPLYTIRLLSLGVDKLRYPASTFFSSKRRVSRRFIKRRLEF